MLCLSRVSVSKPSIKAADVLEASRMCFADANANMLHGKEGGGAGGGGTPEIEIPVLVSELT